jgi:hypothetical protein
MISKTALRPEAVPEHKRAHPSKETTIIYFFQCLFTLFHFKVQWLTRGVGCLAPVHMALNNNLPRQIGPGQLRFTTELQLASSLIRPQLHFGIQFIHSLPFMPPLFFS